MALLFFDTETSGMIDRQLPLADPSQPHIVQLAAILTDDSGTELARMNRLIRPEGWDIHPGAQSVHGIGLEKALAEGESLRAVISQFGVLWDAADIVIGHNIEFDLKMHWRELAYLGLSQPTKTHFCTMFKSINVCKFPNTKGWNGYKWPKLTEAYNFFFGKDFDGAHDALADVLACKEVYFELKRRGL